MSRITEKGKLRQNRGTGHHETYKPWIMAAEFNSQGTCSEIVDWKHGRSIQLLSQGEAAAYYLLRWNDDIDDIREQYPLEIKTTLLLAKEYGFRHPRNGNGELVHMTSDLLVTYQDGHEDVFSVKDSRRAFENRSVTERHFLQREYWNAKGVSFHTVFKEDMDMTLVGNIRRCAEYYDPSRIHDLTGFIRFLIARKIIEIDMKKKIDFRELLKEINVTELLYKVRKEGHDVKFLN